MAGRSVIKVLIDGDTKGLDSALGKADRNIGSMVVNASKKLAIFTAALGGGALVVGKQLVDAASDLNEVTSKTEVIFGKASAGVIDFANKAATSLGQSKTDALNAASTFGVFGKAAGLAGNELGKFSTDMVSLASDLASFSNTSPEEAALALGAALRGESEPIRAYGVMLDDATLKAKAMELGLYKGTGALTMQQKVLAAQASIMEQTTDAQGDFARTQGGMANQSRILSARIENLKAGLGQALLPIALKVVTVFASIIDKVGPLAEKYMPVFADAISYAATKAQAVGEAIGNFLAPHLERIGGWIAQNTDSVKAFFAVLAGAAVVAGVIALGSALAALLNPIGLIVVAVAGLVAGVVYAWNNFETFREVVLAVVDAVRAGVKAFVQFVTNAWQRWGADIVAIASAAWELIRAVVDRVIKTVRGFIEAFIAVVQAIWSRWGEEITAVVVRVWEFIKSTIDNALKIIRGIIQTVTALIKGDWSAVWDGIKTILKGVWDQMQNIVENAWDGIRALVRAGVDKVVEFIKAIPGRIASVASSAFNALKEGFRNAVNFIIRGWNSIEFRIPGFSIGPIGYDGFTLGLPDIPLLADGGIVTKPTLAVIGEAGPEAVVPLSRGRGMGATVNITVNAGMGADGAQIGREIVKALRQYQVANGPLPLRVA